MQKTGVIKIAGTKTSQKLSSYLKFTSHGRLWKGEHFSALICGQSPSECVFVAGEVLIYKSESLGIKNPKEISFDGGKVTVFCSKTNFTSLN